MSIEAVLFDLDGTLIDTAPDMAASLNHIVAEEGLQPLALETIRPHVSRGGLALTCLAFEKHRPEQDIEPLRLRFLDHYLQNIAIHSRLFHGFEELLNGFEKNNITWGVVTNKPAWLTDPLMEQLGLDKRSAVTVSGDTTAQKKPHPLPLQTAAKAISKDCATCMYVGDDPRDIQAGNSAGMTTVIAKYGYITDTSDFASWQSNYQIEHPLDIKNLPGMPI